MNSRRHLKRIDEEDVYALKYNVPFPLHEAASAGDTEAIEYLARRKHVNSYNEVGQMPLHIAAQQGQYEAAKLLLKLDADVNTPDRSSGRTALHLACANGHKSTVELLLKMGAVVYEQDKIHTLRNFGNRQNDNMYRNLENKVTKVQRNGTFVHFPQDNSAI